MDFRKANSGGRHFQPAPEAALKLVWVNFARVPRFYAARPVYLADDLCISQIRREQIDAIDFSGMIHGIKKRTETAERYPDKINPAITGGSGGLNDIFSEPFNNCAPEVITEMQIGYRHIDMNAALSNRVDKSIVFVVFRHIADAGQKNQKTRRCPGVAAEKCSFDFFCRTDAAAEPTKAPGSGGPQTPSAPARQAHGIAKFHGPSAPADLRLLPFDWIGAVSGKRFQVRQTQRWRNGMSIGNLGDEIVVVPDDSPLGARQNAPPVIDRNDTNRFNSMREEHQVEFLEVPAVGQIAP